MSELESMPLSAVHEAIAAAALAGCNCCDSPAAASGAFIDRLKGSLGPIIQELVQIIQAGATNLPAIEAALTAAGIKIPAWLPLIAELLLAIVPKA